MKYKKAIDIIQNRANLENTPFGSAMARNYFHQAMAILSNDKKFSQNELRDYFVRVTYADEQGLENFTIEKLNIQLTEDCVDQVIDVYDNVAGNNLLFTKYEPEDIKMFRYSSNNKPAGNEVGWYQLGQTVYFENGQMIGLEPIQILVKLKTRIFVTSGISTATPGNVIRTILNEDDLSILYGELFIMSCIDKAIEYCEKYKGKL